MATVAGLSPSAQNQRHPPRDQSVILHNRAVTLNSLGFECSREMLPRQSIAQGDLTTGKGLCILCSRRAGGGSPLLVTVLAPTGSQM
jgi:hypothetical protein